MVCIPTICDTRVEQALEKTRPFLQSHAASAELISIADDGEFRPRAFEGARVRFNRRDLEGDSGSSDLRCGAGRYLDCG